jgi:hypothetical protein
MIARWIASRAETRGWPNTISLARYVVECSIDSTSSIAT